jgi:hypothetical protein
MMMQTNLSSSLGDYFFQILPPAIIREIIFQEMLELEDIARLEVAAAVHRLHEDDKVTYIHAHLLID